MGKEVKMKKKSKTDAQINVYVNAVFHILENCLWW